MNSSFLSGGNSAIFEPNLLFAPVNIFVVFITDSLCNPILVATFCSIFTSYTPQSEEEECAKNAESVLQHMKE